MIWFRKLLPFLFKNSPDGAYHWFFVRWCTIKTFSNHESCYSFKLNKVFIWEADVDGAKRLQQIEYKEKLSTLVSEIDQQNIILTQKNERMLWLADRVQQIEGERNVLLLEKEELYKDLSIAETKVSEKDEMIAMITRDKARHEELLNKEICKRDVAMGEFKEFIHQERNNFQNQRAEDLEQYNNNIEKLRKEIEMLDKDFVDVAKAMRLYRQDEDRPVKGFRMKVPK